MARVSGKGNYPYAVARVQAKRAKLIPAAEYPKLLKMDVAEITRYVEESSYKTEVDELSNRFSGLDLLEAALTVSEERVFQDIRSMVQGPGGLILSLWLDRYVVGDLKTVLRGKAAGASRDELLREMLLEDMPTYEMFMPLLADDVKTTDDVIQALERQTGRAREWGRTLQKVPSGSAPSAYEDALGRAYYARLLAALDASKEKGAAQVLEMVRREIDAVNLQNAARWVHAGQTGDFSSHVVPGGKHLKVAAIMTLAQSKDLAQLAEALADTPFAEAAKQGLEAAKATGRLERFQSAIQLSLLADLERLGHSQPLSVLPILLFLIRKHREVVLLRAVARGKAAGLSEERLQELLP